MSKDSLMEFEGLTIRRQRGIYGDAAGKEWLEATVEFSVKDTYGGKRRSQHTVALSVEVGVEILNMAKDRIATEVETALEDAGQALLAVIDTKKIEVAGTDAAQIKILPMEQE